MIHRFFKAVRAAHYPEAALIGATTGTTAGIGIGSALALSDFQRGDSAGALLSFLGTTTLAGSAGLVTGPLCLIWP